MSPATSLALLRSNVLDFSRLSLYGSEVSMAHIAKYKAASCGHMLAHYRRDASSLGRENIDPTRTKKATTRSAWMTETAKSAP